MKIPKTDQLIVFTDLDGTLLDHETYSFEPAMSALELLRKEKIPLILASSKTAAEIEPLRAELGFQDCEAIVENGAGVLLPGNQSENALDTYFDLLGKISRLPEALKSKFIGFSEWSAAKVSQITGLSEDAAALAKKRQFSEPGLWSGSDEELVQFSEYLGTIGIVAQKGGRFLTLSFGGNKADRVKEISNRYYTQTGRGFCIALGDAPNDIAMLEASDLGIIIPNPSHDGIDERTGDKTGKIIRATLSGPEGWNEAVLGVLNKAGIGG